MSDAEFSQLLKRVAGGETLNAELSAVAFGAIMSGGVSESAIASLLTALALRKPTVEEIVGAARAMRGTMKTIDAPAGTIDLCGTGGSGVATLNISTATAFVVAASGVPVAKHGNRTMSSAKSGTADTLEALGANIDIDAAAATRCLRETNVCFLFAPSYHPAMKHATPVRRALGFRTIFNLLGPLCSPARVTRQLVGVYGREWLEPLAVALRELGAETAWVVHGGDGLDEITTTAETHVAVLEKGTVQLRTVSPEDAGLARASLSDILGGTVEENAGAIRRLFAGQTGAYRDIVLFNAAASLMIAGKTQDLKSGAALAARAIDSGGAKDVLERFVATSQRLAA
jgi:anthranilate phosphoribosyltransferase